jgi:hypothetical protein
MDSPVTFLKVISCQTDFQICMASRCLLLWNFFSPTFQSYQIFSSRSCYLKQLIRDRPHPRYAIRAANLMPVRLPGSICSALALRADDCLVPSVFPITLGVCGLILAPLPSEVVGFAGSLVTAPVVNMPEPWPSCHLDPANDTIAYPVGRPESHPLASLCLWRLPLPARSQLSGLSSHNPSINFRMV